MLRADSELGPYVVERLNPGCRRCRWDRGGQGGAGRGPTRWSSFQKSGAELPYYLGERLDHGGRSEELVDHDAELSAAVRGVPDVVEKARDGAIMADQTP